jgi:hypothetical protein
VREKAVSVYRKPDDGYVDDMDWTNQFDTDRLFYTKEAGTYASLKTWIGVDSATEQHGNSILVLLDAQEGRFKYMYIGSQMYTFFLSSMVTAYYSRMGNSDVPYPVALTDSNQRSVHARS